MNAKPKRRWSSFSLRTLLVFVTVASVGFGYFAHKLRQAERQRAAVEALRIAGGRLVRYDYQIDSDGNDLPGFPEPPGPAWLLDRLGIDFLANVTLVNLRHSYP